MRLVRDRAGFELEDEGGVFFLMRDGTSRVVCKVTAEALRLRGHEDGADATVSDTFVRHRELIEWVAACKYDEGHRGTDLVIVLRRDLAPIG